ncbi:MULTISPECIES: DNA cytosine methyltransferase [unclassified Leucobacter]|uniref:DNA cytosine methyltransferase n=1 Tax=unclassified Leucobacter TaxID=2621730 RepID=UPI00301B2A0A
MRATDDLTFLDFFAGFGGASTGLIGAGFQLRTAYNHWDKAIAVHSANHRHADHVQGDLSGYDMRRLPWTKMLWASPECTFHSPAGGRKKPKIVTSESGEPISTDAGVRSRATMFDPIRAAEARGFDSIVIENVVEVADWPLFRPWLSMWESLGYEWQIVNVSAAHVYGPGNAPAGQWRDRIYIVLTKRGIRKPSLQPAPPAYCDRCDRVVTTRQHWKKPSRHGEPVVGKYGRQYVYVCDAGAHDLHVVEPFVLPAASVIDWSDLGIRIGDRAQHGLRDLAPATLRRIEVGYRMFARPAVVGHTGQTWDATNPEHPRYGELDAYYRAWPADTVPLNARQAGGSGDGISVPPFATAINHDSDSRAYELGRTPLPTRSTKVGDGLVFPPHLVDKYDYAGGDARRIRSIENALGTVTTSPHAMLTVPPVIAELYGTSTARGIDNALSAVTAGGNHHGVAVPPGAFLSKHHGGLDYARIDHMNKSPYEPLPTMVTSPNVSLVIPDRTRPKNLYAGDLPFDIEDVRFRMLGPTEHLRAQRFPDDYDTRAANKSETTKGAGNAVAVNVSQWIGGALTEVL